MNLKTNGPILLSLIRAASNEEVKDGKANIMISVRPTVFFNINSLSLDILTSKSMPVDTPRGKSFVKFDFEVTNVEINNEYFNVIETPAEIIKRLGYSEKELNEWKSQAMSLDEVKKIPNIEKPTDKQVIDFNQMNLKKGS